MPPASPLASCAAYASERGCTLTTDEPQRSGLETDTTLILSTRCSARMCCFRRSKQIWQCVSYGPPTFGPLSLLVEVILSVLMVNHLCCAGSQFSPPCGCAAPRRDEHTVVPGRAQPFQTLPGVGAWGNPVSPCPSSRAYVHVSTTSVS